MSFSNALCSRLGTEPRSWSSLLVLHDHFSPSPPGTRSTCLNPPIHVTHISGSVQQRVGWPWWDWCSCLHGLFNLWIKPCALLVWSSLDLEGDGHFLDQLSWSSQSGGRYRIFFASAATGWHRCWWWLNSVVTSELNSKVLCGIHLRCINPTRSSHPLWK